MALEIVRCSTWWNGYANIIRNTIDKAYDNSLSTFVYAYTGGTGSGAGPVASSLAIAAAPSKSWIGSAGYLKANIASDYASPNGCTMRLADSVGSTDYMVNDNTVSQQTFSKAVYSYRVNGAKVYFNIDYNSSAAWTFLYCYEFWAEGHYLLDVAPSSPSCTAGAYKNTITFGAVTGATSYNLYWTSDGSTPTTGSNEITGVTSGYEHTSLSAGVLYKYKIAGVDSDGVGALSSQVSGTPFGIVIPFQSIIIA